MKKVLSFALVAVLFSAVVSCSHDDYQTPSTVLPAAQKDTIDNFIMTKGYSMMELTDSSRIGFLDNTNQLFFQNIMTEGIMYQIMDEGATAQDTVSVTKTSVGSTLTGTVPAYNLITDSTQIISVTYTATLLNGTVIDQESTPTLLYLPKTLISWSAILPKIGKGGHIRFVTPSYYAYANQSSATIPANSPIYFDVVLVAAINNNAGNQL